MLPSWKPNDPSRFTSRGKDGTEKTPPPVGLWMVARGQIRYSDPLTDADSCGVTNVAALRRGFQTNGGPSAIVAPAPGVTTLGLAPGPKGGDPRPRGSKLESRPRNVSTVIGSSSRRRPVLASTQCTREWNGKCARTKSLPPGEVA